MTLSVITLILLVFIFGIILWILFQMKKNPLDLERLERSGRDESAQLRQELSHTLLQFNEAIRNSVEGQLDKMRSTVDEKLQTTLEKRIGESFAQVSDRLEKVHQGLGKMQSLADGVGDLKRVLSNVKSRGVWGEVQLGALLEQVLSPDQYSSNVRIKENTTECVEYAVCLPDGLIPIDAKFPYEDYERLLEASEAGDTERLLKAASDLENRIKTEAKRIHDKYIDIPKTTDFALMFLPTESLYAEVMRRPGLSSEVQRKYKITITGPSTLWAILNSLQMGFRTLAIQKRSSEVWQMLGEAKAEFQKYAVWTDKVKNYLSMATKTLDEAGTRTRAIERKLRDVAELPTSDSSSVESGIPPSLPKE